LKKPAIDLFDVQSCIRFFQRKIDTETSSTNEGESAKDDWDAIVGLKKAAQPKKAAVLLELVDVFLPVTCE